MGYYDHDQPEQGTALSVTTQLMQIFVRLVGVGLLLVGLWAGVKVILEAWALYQQPQRVERFATAIEQGSHLDTLLTRIRPKAANGAPNEGGSTTPAAAEAPQPPPGPVSPEESFRLSYFLAWFIVILLLMLVGRLAMAAIRTGGELALYDTEVKRFARALLEQSRQPQGGAKR
jgi:hypothetical protein